MKTLAKLTVTATALIAVSTHLSLADTNDYRLIAFDNCDIVAEHSLTPAQTNAYEQLKVSQDAMEKVTAPIDAIERDIDRYTSQINDITERAIKRNGSTVTIDRALLAQQQTLSKELEALMEVHSADFAAIEKEADLITHHAHHFETTIAPLLRNTQYDMVRIVGPKYSDAPFSCEDNHALLIM